MSDLRGIHDTALTYEGIVTDNVDPDGRHRIKARIPGEQNETVWARPVTGGGGAAQRGLHAVPAIGSTVFIRFLGGDWMTPIYECGDWGIPASGSEMPTDMKAAGAEAHQVHGFELAGVRFTIDERTATKQVRLSAHVGETEIAFVEIDIVKRILSIFGLAAVLISSTGRVQIDGITAQINKRVVLPTGEPL